MVLGPPISQAADYWGRKWFLVALCLVGGVGSLIVARASSMAMVIAGFTVIGAAFGMQPLLHSVPSEVLPRRWRAWAQAAVMMSNGFGLVAGLLVGGALCRHNPAGFRNFYYIAMACFVLAAVICAFCYQPPPRPLQATLTFQEKVARLDWIGYALLLSSLVLFCVALSWSQNPYQWSDPHVAAPFAVGVALGLGLILYETKFKKDGMFHHGLFKGNRNYVISLICIFCEGVAFFAANIYFAFQVSVLYETDFLIVTTRFSIAFFGTMAASVATGLYCAHTKKVRWATVVAFLIFVAFFACMATADKDSSKPVWGYAVLMGWALGMTLITLVTAAQLAVSADLISIASGLLISVRSLGGTIGIAICKTPPCRFCSVVLTNITFPPLDNAVFISATRHIPDNIAEAAAKAGLPAESIPDFVMNLASQNQAALAQVPGVTPPIIGAGVGALMDTYAEGFRNVWVSAVAFVAIAAVGMFSSVPDDGRLAVAD